MISRIDIDHMEEADGDLEKIITVQISPYQQWQGTVREAIQSGLIESDDNGN